MERLTSKRDWIEAGKDLSNELGYDKPNAAREIKRMQRWCNNRVVFKSCGRFEDYSP